MTDLLKVGVIGLGVMGQNHARVYSELPGVELAAVMDPVQEKRGKYCKPVRCVTLSNHQ